jgi:hypothetical protein
METAAKKKGSLALGVIALVVVLVSTCLGNSAAVASSIASSIGQSLPTTAPSIGPSSTTRIPNHPVAGSKTRAEVFLGVSLKSIERSEQNPINSSRIYDALDGAALECTVAPNRVAIPHGHTRVYRAVSEAEYQDILKTGQLRQGPNSMEGKWFADTIDGVKLHGDALEGAGKYRIIEVDIPDNLPSLHLDPNLDLRGPARYLDGIDLPNLKPRIFGG